MFTMDRLLSAVALVIATVMLAAPAEAAGPYYHTWVSNTGTDNSTCGALPSSACATFAQAYQNTSVGGEITCLNGGYFGGMVITNSITVDCEYSINSLINGTAISIIHIDPPLGQRRHAARS